MPIGVGPCGVCESRASAFASEVVSRVLVVHEQLVLGVAPSTISAEPSGRSRTPRSSSAPKRIGSPCSRRIRFSFWSRTASKAPSL